MHNRESTIKRHISRLCIHGEVIKTYRNYCVFKIERKNVIGPEIANFVPCGSRKALLP
jgi:hypothetical protein